MIPLEAERFREQLRSPDSLITRTAPYEDYHHDATYYSAVPSLLLLAESEEDIAVAVRFCASHGIPITPRGAGTGLSGGCVPSTGALVLSTERLRSLSIQADRRVAICGPGVITKELKDAAEQLGLTYPPDPASYDESTLGGNIAEGAGGLRCKRFGVTKDYVRGLEAVLADGSLIRTGVFNKHRGFSIGDILIGSEGTLAIVTRIALRLIDIPCRGDTILVAFDRPRDAAQTVADITAAGIVPTVMEFLDGDAAACSNEYEKTEGLDNVAAILLLETSDIGRKTEATWIRQFCERNRCSYLRIEPDPEKAETLWQIRRNLSTAVKEIAGLRISEDVAVANSKFPELVDFVASMNLHSRLRINSYGHAGDGNLHVNFMAPSDSAEDLAEIERWVEKLMLKTIELGGTLTGEHGIGLAKKQYLGLEFDEPTLDTMVRIKSVFDPKYLFNPDKIFPPHRETEFRTRST